MIELKKLLKLALQEPLVWTMVYLERTRSVLGTDFEQINLVKALLHEPEVLVLDHIGNDWSFHEQIDLKRVVETFLACDGKW